MCIHSPTTSEPHTKTWMQSQEDSCTEKRKQESRLAHKEPKELIYSVDISWNQSKDEQQSFG